MSDRTSPLDRLIRFCLEQKLVVVLATIGLITWGVLVAPFDWTIEGVPRDPVPVDAIPDIGENQQIVFTEWPGRSPQDIDDQISYPLTVALLRLSGQRAELHGLRTGPAVVTSGALAPFWSGEAYIVWRDHEFLPPLLRSGDRGEGVAWVQHALRELGFFSGSDTQAFDWETEQAVRAFQNDRGLPPDSEVGPLTKMALYRALPRYPIPRLDEQGLSGGEPIAIPRLLHARIGIARAVSLLCHLDTVGKCISGEVLAHGIISIVVTDPVR